MSFPPFAQIVRDVDLKFPAQFMSVQRFPYTNWQVIAMDHKLVLVGSPRNLARQPGSQWLYKSAGGNHLPELRSLIASIPANENKYFNVPDGQMGLDIIRLEDFYTKFPGMYTAGPSNHLLTPYHQIFEARGLLQLWIAKARFSSGLL